MKYGKIDPAHLSMQQYEADTSAGALILGDIGDISYTYDEVFGFQVVFTRHVRVKVFNSNGFRTANFKIPYYYSNELKEKINRVKATAYNLEAGNKIVETDIDKSNLFTEDVSAKEKSLNFSVPNVKNGTVFEVEYHIVSEIIWEIRSWEFQSTVPSLFNELCVSIPEYFNFKTLMKGYLTPSFSDSKIDTRSIFIRDGKGSTTTVLFNDNKHKFRFEHIPAFKKEPFMNALSNYISSIEFEIASVNLPYTKKDYTTTWEKISKNLWNDVDFGTQLKRSCPIRDEADSLKTRYTDPKERMIKAFELIRNSMAFNDRNGIYITKTLRKAWEEKKGKASDINLLLVSLLNEIGIEADPVILSTRSNGMLHPAQIMLSKFNYVIAEARIDNEYFLLDATDKALPFSMLPERCLNGKGRRISQTPELNDWVTLSVNQQNEKLLYAQTVVTPNGNLNGEFNLMEKMYYAEKLAKRINAAANTDEFITEYEAETPGLLISEYTIENLDDLSQPLVMKYKAVYNLSDDSPKDIIYINPCLGAGTNSNPFTTENREFPVDFIIPWSSKIINTMIIPEGYQVAEIPKSAVIVLPDQLGSYKYTIAASGNKVQLMSLIDIRTSQISALNYQDIREFYSRIVEKNAEMIVLKKL
ncbi:MAG: DUF3857 domain-containing protein [Bacteroidota bacterium]